MYLSELIVMLDGVIGTEQSISLAVAMALHPRLGDASPLAVLGADLLPLCVPRMVFSPVGNWMQVLNRV
jgi:hypothetical protein